MMAAAMDGDWPGLNLNREGTWRFDTFRRSPSLNCSIPRRRSYRNSSVFARPTKTARFDVIARVPRPGSGDGCRQPRRVPEPARL